MAASRRFTTSFGWRVLRRVAPLLAGVPLLCADSCVKNVFVSVEYKLRTCPAVGFELPQNVEFGGWTLRAAEGAPYCHGFLRYELDEIRSVGAFSEGVKSAVVYARVDNDRAHGSCALTLVTDLYCNSRETLDDCDPKGHYVGVFRGLKTGSNDYADLVAQRLLLGQKTAPVLPARNRVMLGRVAALEAYCQKL